MIFDKKEMVTLNWRTAWLICIHKYIVVFLFSYYYCGTTGRRFFLELLRSCIFWRSTIDTFQLGQASRNFRLQPLHPWSHTAPLLKFISIHQQLFELSCADRQTDRLTPGKNTPVLTEVVIWSATVVERNLRQTRAVFRCLCSSFALRRRRSSTANCWPSARAGIACRAHPGAVTALHRSIIHSFVHLFIT